MVLATAVVARIVPARFRPAFLAVASIAYLGQNAPGTTATVLGLGAIVWSYARFGGGRARRGLGTAIALGLLAVLVGFKGFAAAVPLGMSYYVFKLLGLALDARRGAVKAAPGLAESAAWLTLFPAFTAGPIEHHAHFARQAPAATLDDALHGAKRIAFGLVKKAVLVDLLLVPSVGSTGELFATLATRTPGEAWLWIATVFLWGYLDFSAYCDLAIGSVRLFGYQLQENFDWPILATSIASFWKRWHMSLAAFCQAYVYLPTIGWTRRPTVAVFSTFVAMALWHDLSLNWVMWGLWHALGVTGYLALGRRIRGWTWLDRPWGRVVGWAATMGWVGIGQAWSIGPSVGASARLVGKLFGVG